MEGPSLVILHEELAPFRGKRVLAAAGNTRQLVPSALEGRVLSEVLTWGKHLLLHVGSAWIKIHFLMYGSYRIDEPKPGREPRLHLRFRSGDVYFYSCSVQLLAADPRETYDWSSDPLSPQWSELAAIRRAKRRPGDYVCDLLLDQEVFSGVGNIIKNEVLHRQGLHPLTRVGELSARELRALVRDTVKYCHEFYEWKKRFELRKHWKIYRKRACGICQAKPRHQKTGKLERVSFYCETCQSCERHARAA